MCEAIVCIRDMGNSGNPLIDSHAPQQGDVVFVGPDGWNWGKDERSNATPFFRILQFPNITETQASVMLAREVDTDPQNPSLYLQFRAKFFDKTKIPVGLISQYWNDDTRAAPFIVIPYTAAQLQNIISSRPPYVVPDAT